MRTGSAVVGMFGVAAVVLFAPRHAWAAEASEKAPPGATSDAGDLEAWYQVKPNEPAPEAVAKSVGRFVAETAKAERKEARKRAEFLATSVRRIFRDVPEARKAALDAGLAAVIERWIVAGSDAKAPEDRIKTAEFGLQTLRELEVSEDYLRRVVAPLVTSDAPAGLRATAFMALQSRRFPWSCDLLLKALERSLEDGDLDSGMNLPMTAMALAQIGDPKAIPVMIAVIDAADSDSVIRALGEYGLKPLTGVEFNEDHDGAWWRDWWEKNKNRYPPAVRAMDIPRLKMKPKPRRDVSDASQRAGPGAASRAVDPRLRELIADVRKEEARYQNLEVVWRTVYRPARPKPAGPPPHSELTIDCRSVLQNGMAYLTFKGDSREAPGQFSGMDRVLGFDGTTTRIYDRGGTAKIVEGPDDDLRPFQPHTVLFRYEGECLHRDATLTGVLGGADMAYGVQVRSEYLGDEEAAGLKCRKIAITYFAPPDPHGKPMPSGRRFVWIAPQRNCLAVKQEIYDTQEFTKFPALRAVAEAFREIAPGVWFPMSSQWAVPRGPAKEDGTYGVSETEQYRVVSVSLNPKYDAGMFRDIEIPKGTPTRRIRADGTERSFLMGMRGASDRERMVAAIAANDLSPVRDLAVRIGEREKDKAIPFLIGVLDADNSPETLYDVGYFGLRFTGVEFSPLHDGPWWRRWWEANRTRFPEDVRNTPIPALEKTKHGRQYKLLPADIDTLQGKLKLIAEALDGWNASREDWSARPRIELNNLLSEVGKHRDPHAIPYLLGVIEADKAAFPIAYSALRTITGIEPELIETPKGQGQFRKGGAEYRDGHDAAWWQQWWQANKSKYPADVQAIPIPDYRNPLTFSWKEPTPEEARRARAEQLRKTPPRDPKQEAAALVDVADVPAQDLRAGDDADKRYFLIGSVEKTAAPPDGYALLIVLPGGDGSADFHPFIRRIYKHVLSKRWLIAQLVAPEWDENQFRRLVWPTERLRYPAARFTTEEFVLAVVADVRTKAEVDPKRIFLLGWSSGGPPCYATTLRKDSPVAGAFIAMSVFRPEQMPPLENAKGKAFYLLQSPDDRVTPMRFAEAAGDALRAAGAKVQLQQYPGGHGWRGPIWQLLRDGVTWLEEQGSKTQ